VAADVGRVTPSGERVRVYVMLGWSEDYGSCSLTAHAGDSERVALDLAIIGPGDARIVRAYTAAHEGTVNDHGTLLTEGVLDTLVFTPNLTSGGARWVVFSSADKHATYPTVSECENASFVPCIEEDCAPDDVVDASLYDLLPEIVNAGEPNAPRIDELDVIGFPNDRAWAEQDFCGGQSQDPSEDSCSSPVREKLLDDPFG
jgi:hypothetical protein